MIPRTSFLSEIFDWATHLKYLHYTVALSLYIKCTSQCVASTTRIENYNCKYYYTSECFICLNVYIMSKWEIIFFFLGGGGCGQGSQVRFQSNRKGQKVNASQYLPF